MRKALLARLFRKLKGNFVQLLFLGVKHTPLLLYEKIHCSITSDHFRGPHVHKTEKLK